MTDFLIAAAAIFLNPWLLAIAILSLFVVVGGNAYLAKRERDRLAAIERRDADEARVREQVRQIVAAELGRSRQAASPANRREPAEWFFPGDGAA